jgi:hypothetical protein
MPVIDIRAHGGTYAAGKYRKGGEYTDEQVKLVTTKGNGKPYWENNTGAPIRVVATASYVFGALGSMLYKYDANGTYIGAVYNGGSGTINDLDSNEVNFVMANQGGDAPGLRFYNDSGGIIWYRLTDSSPIFYTSGQTAAINSNGEVLYGVSWQGGGVKNFHKFNASGSVIWNATIYSGSAGRSSCHLPDGGAAVLDTTGQIEIFNSSGQVVRTFYAGAGTINCLTADSDGYLYVVVNNNGNIYVRKCDTSGNVIKEAFLGADGNMIYKVMVKGSYVYTPFGKNVVKLKKDDLGIVSYFPQPETSPVYGLFVNSQGDLFLANNSKVRKINPRHYYNLV